MTTPAKAPAAESNVPAAIFAAIVAAVHSVAAGRLRVVSIVSVHDHEWAREGRRDIFSSHRVR